ncbi:hypothetical protein TNCV_112831 [Trichonephila clavipes]|nr:hypothetical protein TNCV_112831 [Trichonephila clavipes]
MSSPGFEPSPYGTTVSVVYNVIKKLCIKYTVMKLAIMGYEISILNKASGFVLLLPGSKRVALTLINGPFPSSKDVSLKKARAKVGKLIEIGFLLECGTNTRCRPGVEPIDSCWPKVTQLSRGQIANCLMLEPCVDITAQCHAN